MQLSPLPPCPFKSSESSGSNINREDQKPKIGNKRSIDATKPWLQHLQTIIASLHIRLVMVGRQKPEDGEHEQEDNAKDD